MIKVNNKIKLYEIDGKSVSDLDNKVMSVDSHWCNDDRVVLTIGEKRVTVVASDLKIAIENATNVNRW